MLFRTRLCIPFVSLQVYSFLFVSIKFSPCCHATMPPC